MREVEVTILEINVEATRKKLLDLGAKKVFDGDMSYFAFDFPDNRLNKKGELLRIRKVGNKTEITHKSKKENVEGFKIKKEIETQVKDFEVICEIFEKCGMKIIHQGQKKRESYKLGSTNFEIDFVPGIPAFLEIETQDEKEIQKAVTMLDFNMKQTTAMTGKEIEEYYKKV